ncbi:hypothetical protein AB0M28_26175 [Streptomyces sp. NPDC051940]|uniref:hypothetical protein n=1 Tax=Streptomyces sp. NPDC051940 TaxID=3155675 RepID=UPI003422D0A5
MPRALLRPVAVATLGLAAALTAAAPAVASPEPWRDVSPAGAADSVFYDVESRGGETWAVGISIDASNAMHPYAARWTGSGWETPAQPTSGEGRLDELAVAGPDDAWAVGSAFSDRASEAVLQHWDGTAWTRIGLPLPVDASHAGLSAVTVAGDGSAWIAASYSTAEEFRYAVLRRDADGSWSEVPGGAELGWLSQLQTAPDGSVYAITNTGIVRFDGTRWTGSPLPAQLDGALYDAVEVRSADDVWAVGHLRHEAFWRRPVVIHFDGHAWREVRTPAETGQLYDIAFDRQGRPVAIGESQNPAVSPNGDYVLTLDRTGRFTHTESVPGAGYLHGATADESGRIWAVGGTNDPAGPSGLPYAFAGIRD